MTDARSHGWSLRRRLAGRIGVTLFLTAVWVMLWGNLGPLTVLGGLVVGVVLATLIRQPSAPLGTIRGTGLPAALGLVAIDVARSTVKVAWAAVRTGPATRSELLTVQAPPCPTEVLVLVSSLITLSPGTMVVEIDDERGRLLTHVLPVSDVEDARAALQRMVTRLVHALSGGRST